MQMRYFGFLVLALLASAPAVFAQEDSLREEIAALKKRAEAIEAQRQALFEREVDAYLAETNDERGAQGGDALQGITITARLTGVFLATVGADPNDTHALHGDVDVDVDFQVTDNLELFIYTTANSPGAAFPTAFGPRAGTAGATLSGVVDGIGVDGTVSTNPGALRVSEAGVRWQAPIGSKTLHVMFGKLDPRNYYAQNAFAGDPNTQFLNNLFDDPPALNWPTNATGPTIYGLQLWMTFGANDQYRVDLGWFNGAGQWFSNGILLGQFTWTTDLFGRETNVRVYGQADTAPTEVSAAFGVSWDWWATEKIGVFFRATIKDNQSPSTGEFNQVESDWQGGAIFNGLIPSRPDDTLGVAIGYIKGPVRAIIPGATENHEMTIEIYYRFMHEDGKLQITPVAQFIFDPGAGSFVDPDLLVLLGIRLHVPF